VPKTKPKTLEEEAEQKKEREAAHKAAEEQRRRGAAEWQTFVEWTVNKGGRPTLYDQKDSVIPN
jgi:hypothetical protein